MSNAMERINHHSHVTERLMFLPTGEVFKDERNNSYYHSDFLFSGKELDAETGNYYFGARYLAPRATRRKHRVLSMMYPSPAFM